MPITYSSWLTTLAACVQVIYCIVARLSFLPHLGFCLTTL